ncbi:YgjV family protein [Maribacter polysiphoniae]|uniref:Inner membrane protein n=1 Tax=Maribacter polysiphoniae TaxID=429344 RepID=A0A316DYS3_9FLAO|nr:YgjV family protein [Maribacter polysiphoniae]MBD1261711.1 YgjV family protein [Maribacter polysiphoniae]PWK22482.1 inner membrane protein [Maribacter polysiphoniae]
MNVVAELLGYIAIATGFFAITKKEMGAFRLWHLISSFFYIIYGVFLESIPLIIAGVVFCIIHVYHLNKIKKERVNSTQKS